MSDWKFTKQTNYKKELTIDNIKEDYFLSKFLLRVYFLEFAFEWQYLKIDNLSKSQIKNASETLEKLGLITTGIYSDLDDFKREIVLKTFPNFKEFDKSNPITYIRNETLVNEGKQIVQGIIEKYQDNKSLSLFIESLASKYRTYTLNAKNIIEEENNLLSRCKTYPDGTIVEVKTKKFYEQQIALEELKQEGFLENKSKSHALVNHSKSERKDLLLSIKEKLKQKRNEGYSGVYGGTHTTDLLELGKEVKVPKNYNPKALKDLTKDEVKVKVEFEKELNRKGELEHKALRHGSSLNIFERQEIQKEAESFLESLE